MKFLASIAAILLLTSCVQVPKQEPYPLFNERMASQHKLQAAGHWLKLADKLASEWFETIKELRAPLSIESTDNSPFGKAMTTFLTTAFLNKGIQISSADSDLHITWEIQPVYHNAIRRNSPGLLEMLLLDLPQFIFLGELDCGYKPHTEVIITFNLQKNNLLYDKMTAIFYINDLDLDHYRSGIRYSDYPLLPVSYNLTNR